LEKRQLLVDFLERAQALSVEAELLLQDLEHEDGEGWFRLEQARIHCDIAHLGLISHVNSHGCGEPARIR
jgi:hypothetical protein